MTSTDQEPPAILQLGTPGSSWRTWFSNIPAALTAAWMRAVQAYDVESGLCTFNGMHANAGFLPVVPGPCGMFRAEATTQIIIGRVRMAVRV